MPIPTLNKLLVCSLLMATLLITGCPSSNRDKRESGSLKGTVTTTHGAATHGTVRLYSPSSAELFTAALDDSGNYLLERVPVGEYGVEIVPEIQGLGEGSSQAPATQIAVKYRSSATSGIQVSIKKGQNELNLKLE